jgi:hypothetical protein
MKMLLSVKNMRPTGEDVCEYENHIDTRSHLRRDFKNKQTV